MITTCDRHGDDTRFSADICIIGAGPAGLTLAAQLDGGPHTVLVVEAGGYPGTPDGLHEAGVAEMSGDFDAPALVPHRFGGAANEWIVRLPWNRRGVRMVPLSPIDLERRSWIPNSGWPISWDELQRYYGAATRFLSLDERGYELDAWTDDDHQPLAIDAAGFSTGVEQFADPRRFTRDLLDVLEASPNVHVVLGGSAGQLQGSPSRATVLEIDHDRPARLSAAASRFVVATGGLENARLLLDARAGAGFGGGSDIVGRFYTDHHRVFTGTLTPARRDLFSTARMYDLTQRATDAGSARPSVMGKLIPTAALLRSEELLHSASMLLPKPSPVIAAGRSDIGRLLRGNLRVLGERRSASRVARTALHSLRLGVGLTAAQRRMPPRIDAGWSGVSGRWTPFERFDIETQIELAPDAGNRLTLGTTVDRFGRRRCDLTWRWSDADLDSLRRTADLLGRAFEHTGVGAFAPTRWGSTPELTTPSGAFHPSGTTRMSATAHSGVVDDRCRVHGTDNLFVIGSSTFPTVGYANPTLTIIALALRLADHLSSS